MTTTRAFSGLLVLLTASVGMGLEPELEIRDLEQQIAEAVVRRDTDFVQRVWGEDFFYTGVRGEIKTKQDVLEELAAGELAFQTLQFEDVRVRVYGQTAVATGRALTKGTSPQGEITGQVRYTRVYVKRDSAWQLVAFQGTLIPQQTGARQ